MVSSKKPAQSRRAFLGKFASTLLISAAPTYANAAGFLKGAGDIRRIRMRSARTGESIDTIYWIEGEYITEALTEVNKFMRDWREGSFINYDRRNIDIMAASLRLMETDEPYHMVSGYRSPSTNALLRSRNRAVARNSYHTKGMAADLKLSGRSIYQMASAAKACNAGGVGTYRRSQFVHMDCGPIRTWNG